MKGIDISHHQGAIDWRKVHESGITHVYLKASEYHEDHMVREHLSAIEAYHPDPRRAPIDGLSPGLYHLWSGELGVRQTDLMMALYRELMNADTLTLLCPSIDLETRKLKAATKLPARACWESHLLEIVSRIAHDYTACMLYLSRRGATILRAVGIWDALWAIPGARLWLMDRALQPRALRGAPQWSWWQHSSQGIVDGITREIRVHHPNGTDTVEYKPRVDLDEVR